jgi:hypothetical protein
MSVFIGMAYNSKSKRISQRRSREKQSIIPGQKKTKSERFRNDSKPVPGNHPVVFKKARDYIEDPKKQR